MVIANVSYNDVATEAWADSVADTVNGIVATLTTDGQLLTRAAGVLAPITRAALAADAAFTAAFVAVPTAWTGVTFTNSWVNFGSTFQNCQYRKVGDEVQLRGTMKTGTVNTAAFTLPAGFRPPADVSFAQSSNALFGLLIISSAGVVTPAIGSNVSFGVNCHFSITA